MLMYMRVMLEKAEAARVEVRRQNFMDYGKKLQLFKGVPEWFQQNKHIWKRGRVPSNSSCNLVWNPRDDLGYLN